MSYILRVVRDNPVGLWPLDDGGSTMDDFSGNENDGTFTGSKTKVFPLVQSSIYSLQFDSTVSALFPSSAPIYRSGHEDIAFSFEAWVQQIQTASGSTSDQVVLGSLDQIDGIVVNGTVVTFRLKLSSGDLEIVHDTLVAQKMHIVGVYAINKMRLYINGIEVGEYDITGNSLDSTFIPTDTNLYTGYNAGGQQLAISALAIYNYPLSAKQVANHYAAGVDVPAADNVSSTYNGIRIPINRDYGDTFLIKEWQAYEDFEDGYFNGIISLENNPMLQSDIDDDTGLTLGGTWQTTVQLDPPDIDTVYGVVLDWEGCGVSIDVSVDGVVWSNVTSGIRSALIPSGFSTALTKDLYIRATFTAGDDPDAVYLSFLRATVFKTGNIKTETLRSIVVNGNVSLNSSDEPFRGRDDIGIYLSGGALIIGADADTDIGNTQTVELWVKRLDGSNFVVSLDGTAWNSSTMGTQYKNGATGSAQPSVGQWVLMHLVLNTAVTNTIQISHSNLLISNIVLYERQLSATEVSDIFNMYTRNDAFRHQDTGQINMPGGHTTGELYAYDWSIAGAG